MGKKGVTITGVTEIPHNHPEEFTMTNEEKTQPGPSKQIWVKLTVLLVIICSIAALLATYVYISHLKQANKELQQQALELEEANKELQSYIDNKDTDEGMADVATGELGMVDPDTIIYDFD